MKNINQLQMELKCCNIESYDDTLPAGDMKTIEHLPPSFQPEWKQSLIFGIS